VANQPFSRSTFAEVFGLTASIADEICVSFGETGDRKAPRTRKRETALGAKITIK